MTDGVSRALESVLVFKYNWPQGVPVKVVSEMLGHADVSTTLRIYAHVLEGAQAQAVDAMDRLLHG